MKSLIIDLLGLIGFGLLTAGVYLQFRLPTALIFAGGMLLSGAVLAVMRGNRAT